MIEVSFAGKGGGPLPGVFGLRAVLWQQARSPSNRSSPVCVLLAALNNILQQKRCLPEEVGEIQQRQQRIQEALDQAGATGFTGGKSIDVNGRSPAPIYASA